MVWVSPSPVAMAYTTAFLAIALFLVAQPALGKPAAESKLPDVNQLIKEFQTSLDNSISEAKKNLNLPENPDGAAVVRVVKEQTAKAEKNLKEIQGKVEETIKKNPQLQETLENLKKKIEEGREKLAKENPEVAANLQKATDLIKESYGKMSKELQRVNSEVSKPGGVRDDLENLFKNIFDRTTVLAKDFQKTVQEAINEKKA